MATMKREFRISRRCGAWQLDINRAGQRRAADRHTVAGL